MTHHILLHSGKYHDLRTVCAETQEYRIEDIAHALSHICRFTGHTRWFYSVAQHSVHVAELVPPEYRLEALMHDASEAYLGDVSSPLKAMLPDYHAIEKVVEMRIAAKFGLPLKQTPAVKIADMRMLVTERRDLLPTGEPGYVWPMFEPAPWRIDPWPSEFAKQKFAERFIQYSKERAQHVR